jgi:hypothetical protein
MREAPLADIRFALKHGTQPESALKEGLFGDLSLEDIDAIFAEAGRMASHVIAPLNRIGDRCTRSKRWRTDLSGVGRRCGCRNASEKICRQSAGRRYFETAEAARLRAINSHTPRRFTSP